MSHPLIYGSAAMRDYLRELARAEVGLRVVVDALEQQYALEALKLHKGNITKAAQALGVHRNTLARYVDAEMVREAKG